MRRAFLWATLFLLAACSPLPGDIPIAGSPGTAEPTAARPTASIVPSATPAPTQRPPRPPRATNGKLERGGLYAPLLLNRYTTVQPAANGARQATLYWLVSTWNPYEVAVIRSTLEVNAAAR